MTGSIKIMGRAATLLVASLLALAPAFAEGLTPKETYLKYREALAAAKSVEDVQPMFCKKVNDEIAKTPADDRPMMFDFIKSTTPKDFEVQSEDVKDDNATLQLTASTVKPSPDTHETTTGTVTLVKEDGVWKIDKETWDSKIESTGNSPPESK